MALLGSQNLTAFAYKLVKSRHFVSPFLMMNIGLFPTVSPEYRKENEVKTPLYSPKEIVREEIKYVEIPAKKITEIRIFFDNGTYETFKPEN